MIIDRITGKQITLVEMFREIKLLRRKRNKHPIYRDLLKQRQQQFRDLRK